MQSRFIARIAGSRTHAISFAYTSSHEGRTNFTVAVFLEGRDMFILEGYALFVRRCGFGLDTLALLVV